MLIKHLRSLFGGAGTALGLGSIIAVLRELIDLKADGKVRTVCDVLTKVCNFVQKVVIPFSF